MSRRDRPKPVCRVEGALAGRKKVTMWGKEEEKEGETPYGS